MCMCMHKYILYIALVEKSPQIASKVHNKIFLITGFYIHIHMHLSTYMYMFRYTYVYKHVYIDIYV